MEDRAGRALILRLRGVGESDLLVDLFGDRLGRITALAKGAKRSKKRFTGRLLTGQLIAPALLPTKNPELPLLESAQVEERFLGLRTDYRRLLAAGPIWELLLRVIPAGAVEPAALALALATLGRQAGARPDEAVSALVIFLVRLLDLLGYGLHLKGCLACGRAMDKVKRPRLSPEGGLVCEHCPPLGGETEVPPGLARGLLAAQTLNLEALNRLTLVRPLLAPALAYLTRFWRQVSGYDLLSLKVAGCLTRQKGRVVPSGWGQ